MKAIGTLEETREHKPRVRNLLVTSVACPKCGARISERCTLGDARPMGGHVERWHKYEETLTQ